MNVDALAVDAALRGVQHRQRFASLVEIVGLVPHQLAEDAASAVGRRDRNARHRR